MRKKRETHSIDMTSKFPIDDPIHQVHEYSIDAKTNQIYLMGEPDYIFGGEVGEPGVEYIMASRFIKNLNILMRRNSEPILIHLKSCGGDWSEGMAIYDTIKACPNPITILSYTHARSMSSLIFLAANKRVMMPNSVFLFHEGTIEISGTSKQVKTYVEHYKLSERTMLDIYINSLKRHGSLKKWSKGRIEKWLIDRMNKKEDVYLTSQEAVKYGFADEIFGTSGVYDWTKLLEYTNEQLEAV